MTTFFSKFCSLVFVVLLVFLSLQMALDPQRVLTGNVHKVTQFRPGFKLCLLSPERGLLHHYRLWKWVPAEADRLLDDAPEDIRPDALAKVARLLEKADDWVAR